MLSGSKRNTWLLWPGSIHRLVNKYERGFIPAFFIEFMFLFCVEKIKILRKILILANILITLPWSKEFYLKTKKGVQLMWMY